VNAPILSLNDVTARFGGVRAVSGVGLSLMAGELAGLIGPNGAGKTTIFNLITGSVIPAQGEIHFKDRSIAGKAPDELCHLGIARTFQNIRLFPRMTAFENVALGLHSRPHYTIFEAFIRTPRAARSDTQIKKRVFELLELVDLPGHAYQTAGNLPYGHQRRLELARAMATGPELLLLDEPAAGMNEDECHNLVAMIRRIHAAMGYTIFLIEHHMNVVMELCQGWTIHVLNLGEILASGSPEAIQANERVVSAYLGSKRNRNAASQPLS
jgi:branched-chain amino acid transport system ATP-binding protein